VNSWLQWSTCTQPLVQSMVDVLTGKNAKFDTAEYNNTLNKVKNEAIALNGALKGKKFLVGDKVTLADLVCAWTLMPAFQLILDAGFRKGKAEVAAWFESVTSLPEFKKSAGNIKACAKAMKPPGASGDAKAAPAKATKKEKDDMDDLFGSDSDDGAAAAAAAKAKAAKNKKVKAPVIAQSLIMFEIKPLDSDTDLDAVAKRVLAIRGPA